MAAAGADWIEAFAGLAPELCLLRTSASLRSSPASFSLLKSRLIFLIIRLGGGAILSPADDAAGIGAAALLLLELADFASAGGGPIRLCRSGLSIL